MIHKRVSIKTLMGESEDKKDPGLHMIYVVIEMERSTDSSENTEYPHEEASREKISSFFSDFCPDKWFY